MKIPYHHRGIVQALGWRKWDPRAKAWRILAGDLPDIEDRLRAAGCEVRHRQRKAKAQPMPAPWEDRADLREGLAERQAERTEREHWFEKMVTLLDGAYGDDEERCEAAVAAAGGPPLLGSEDEYDRLASYVRAHP